MATGPGKLVIPPSELSVSRGFDAQGRRIVYITETEPTPISTQAATVKPNSYPAKGPIGNTTGLIVPDTAPNPTSNAAPAITPTEKEQGWWKRWGSDVTHGALDVVGLIPGVGIITEVANALIYTAEGDYVLAGVSVLAMIPGEGDVVIAGKYALKTGEQVEKQVIKQSEKQLEKQGEKQLEKQGEKQGEKEAEKEAEKKGGKDLGNPRCLLRPYRVDGIDTCKPNRTGHHVVPDRVFRVGKRGSTNPLSEKY